jgi:predicted phosphodiesterase
MRYAIIADIHANLEALIAAERAIEAARVDEVICLGDLVGYYAHPNQCVWWIRQRGIRCVQGNHDAAAIGGEEPQDFSATASRGIHWTRAVLDASNAEYLATLPLWQKIDERFVIVHAALHPEANHALRISSAAEAQRTLEMLARVYHPLRLCFYGHTHHRAAYALRDGTVIPLHEPTITVGGAGVYLINPGSIGQSRDDDPRASLAVYDTEREIVEFRRVDYDRATTLAAAAAAGLIRPRHPLVRSVAGLARRLRRRVPYLQDDHR